ncbi:tripartite tricarboxylate transporter substrate binding protein [Paenibacillus sp. P96]|uniref:Tripartite tricarboxylate transporter substrate binding protein n=1 Tax=Paenibacillus zeirhizosphaerae TaxID=2987519 RepID=A0ABT9FVH0_9BACL|nr:tripartite tricarboxylate transporter substrate binding protein [Paenibacillus sp. P96]MDP4098733.1 tripartite tricarboxylate transporter substrate binding protein [Paenibacillus sp. P96]
MKKSASRMGKYGFLLAGLLTVTLAVAGCGSGQQSKQTAAGTQNAAGSADRYPDRAIEYVVPYAAGGGVDLVARAVAEKLSEKWGQPVNVVNKPGGGGATGAQYALNQAQPDGYTVMANVVSLGSMMTAGYTNPPVKQEDQIFVSRIVQDVPAFTVKGDAQWQDFKAFSNWVKANPDQLTWTTSGVSGFSSFAVAEWLNEIGVDISKTRMIVTKGTAESIPLVAGGNAVLAVHPVSEVSAMAEAGKLKILAVSGENRSPYFPDVPTAKEQGVENLSAFWWTGVSMAKGTPGEIVQKWDEALAELAEDPDFIAKLEALKLQPSYLNQTEYNPFLQKETEYYTELASKLGLRK